MRKTFAIHGGVHPPENKHQSVRTPIRAAGIPDELVFPLSQHIGAPAEQVVQVGDAVLKGQKIAEAQGFVSVPVHASTSGTIMAIEARTVPHASGMSGRCIVLKPDGQDRWIDHSGLADYTQAEPADLVKRIRDAGIAGMGGAGFPSAVKLGIKPGTVIETLIINGTECEPYITADDILMRERADQVIEGVKILRHIIKPKEVLIGVEDNKPEGIAALQKAAAGSGIDVVVFPTKYPSGGEKQLIQILTGKEVPSGKLPADIGVVCQNIGTTTAIYRAIVHGEPLIQRITTVTGDAVKEPQNLEVLLGTPLRHVLSVAGYEAPKADRLIVGGPMMGFAMPHADIPVVKTTNCVLAPTARELPPPPPAQACIRCGMCAEACPVSLLPQQMYWFAMSKNHDALQEHHLFDCIECGACSYVCPSSIPLVQYYRASKADIRQQEQEKRKADYSKQRYEARQARLQKLEDEKEAKRKARQEAAAAAKASSDTPSDAQAIIQAAVERTQAKKQVSADPAAAAIERAQAAREGRSIADADPLATARATVANTEKRLQTAREKLAQAEAEGSDKIDAFRTGVEKTEAKLQEAREALAKLEAEAPAATTPAADDPVQAIIERAKAKRAGQAVEEEDPVAKLERLVSSTESRIQATRDKITMAETDAPDKVDALKTGLEKLQEKLAQLNSELANARASQNSEAQ
ncbi:MAG: electron transport complex subunit RsxC [Gammaproteobacteria bacterium]|nr:MAG: electron transport complex subunit RsxC [Gammaproteobacteria bacterium]